MPSSIRSCRLAKLCACIVAAWAAGPAYAAGHETAGQQGPTVTCLPSGEGFVHARIAGAVSGEIRWGNDEMECDGAMRPTDGGVRARFSGPAPDGAGKLVLVFGIANLREGRVMKLAPVNVTVMREGKGEFYSTQGDDKCILDEVRLDPLIGVPHRLRSYRLAARGACTEPARAVRGAGAVMLTRFDLVGRVDFESEDEGETPIL